MSLIDHSACNLMKNAWNIQKMFSCLAKRGSTWGQYVLFVIVPSHYSWNFVKGLAHGPASVDGTFF